MEWLGWIAFTLTVAFFCHYHFERNAEVRDLELKLQTAYNTLHRLRHQLDDHEIEPDPDYRSNV